MRRALTGLAVTGLAVTLLAAGCTAGRSGPGGSARPAPLIGHHIRAGTPTDWPTYHGDAARSGLAPPLPAAGKLAIGWSRPLDGAVYGQPLALGDMVIAATENDSVYGLDRLTGQVRWKAHVATSVPLSAQPCGNIDPIGITSTPVYYRGLVWVLAQAGRSGHQLIGLHPATGAIGYQRAVPAPDGQPYFDQQRSALAAGSGRIYITFGGHAGDCGPYIGSVVGMPVSRTGPIVSYRVPTSLHGGIWAPGGPAIGPGGTIYVGVGNGATSPPFDDTDSVTALSPDLRRIGVFAPRIWVADNKGDLDLGSMTPALVGAGGVRRVVMVGKRGTGYLLRAGGHLGASLGGVGGQVAQLAVCPAFGAAAVTGSTVIVPCASGGPAALAVTPGTLRLLWRGPAKADGSPVIGGGAVWATANSAGVLYQLSPRTGKITRQLELGTVLPHFASPSLSGRLVLIGTMHGVIAVTGA